MHPGCSVPMLKEGRLNDSCSCHPYSFLCGLAPRPSSSSLRGFLLSKFSCLGIFKYCDSNLRISGSAGGNAQRQKDQHQLNLSKRSCHLHTGSRTKIQNLGTMLDAVTWPPSSRLKAGQVQFIWNRIEIAQLQFLLDCRAMRRDA